MTLQGKRGGLTPGVVIAAAILFVVMSGAVASAQDDGAPVVIGQNEELQTLVLETPTVTVDLFGRYEQRDIDHSDGRTTREQETLYRGVVELETTGFVGHPNFINLKLFGALQLSYEDVESSTANLFSSSTESILRYDVSAIILQRSNYPVTIYSRRDQTLVDRQFGGTLDNTVFENGIRASLRSDIAPTQLHIFRREQKQEDRLGGTEYDYTQNTVELHGQVRPAEGQSLLWDYTFDDVNESTRSAGDNSFDRHDLLGSHTYDFGDARQHQLRSSAQMQSQSGRNELDRFRWDERLRLRHTKNFETRYDLVVDRNERPGSTQSLQRVSAGFRHQLYDSLVTTGQFDGSNLEFEEENFTSDDRSANLDLEYTKRVPYGRLVATSGMRISRREEGERGTTILISDETRRFSVAGTILIDRRNVVVSSIFLTDAAGIVVYQEGADFTVREFADRVEIRRVLAGLIPPTGVVRIDYEIGPEPGSTTDTQGWSASVRYRVDEGPLSGLSLFGRYFQQDQDRTGEGLLELPEDDIKDLTYGIEYDWWDITLLAEQRTRTGSLSSFGTVRLEGRYVRRFDQRGSMTLSVRYQDTDHSTEGFRTKITTFSGRWNQKLTDTLRLGVEVLWRDEQDSSGLDSSGFEQSIDLNWNYRQTTIYARFRNALLESEADDSNSQHFLLGVRREF